MTVHDLIAEGLITFASAWSELDGYVRAQVVAAVRGDWDANDVVPNRKALELAKAKIGGFNAEIDEALEEALRSATPARDEAHNLHSRVSITQVSEDSGP